MENDWAFQCTKKQKIGCQHVNTFFNNVKLTSVLLDTHKKFLMVWTDTVCSSFNAHSNLYLFKVAELQSPNLGVFDVLPPPPLFFHSPPTPPNLSLLRRLLFLLFPSWNRPHYPPGFSNTSWSVFYQLPKLSLVSYEWLWYHWLTDFCYAYD